MKAYELLLMIKPNIDSEDVQNVVNKIADSVANLGGKVIDTDLNGRKKLAYDIDNFSGNNGRGTRYDIIADGCVVYHDIAEAAVDRLCEEMERKPWLYSNIEVKELN